MASSQQAWMPTVANATMRSSHPHSQPSMSLNQGNKTFGTPAASPAASPATLSPVVTPRGSPFFAMHTLAHPPSIASVTRSLPSSSRPDSNFDDALESECSVRRASTTQARLSEYADPMASPAVEERRITDLAESMRSTFIEDQTDASSQITMQSIEPEAPLPNPYHDRYPHPSLAPEDIVEIQLGAMKYNDQPCPDGGIEISFRFASPANRMYTGPLDRFTRMIYNPLYACLLHHDRFQMAPANPIGSKWRVAITKQGVTTVFLWSLSKQMLPPHTGCWMTDSVLLIRE